MRLLLRIRLLWIIGLLLLVGVVPASAQTVPQTLIVQWEVDGPPALSGGARPPFSVADAQAYIYKLYIVGSASGVSLAGVQCTTTADPFIKTCSAQVPTSHSAPGLQVDITVTDMNGVESAHSTAATVPPLILPPSAPRNLRLLRSITSSLPTK